MNFKGSLSHTSSLVDLTPLVDVVFLMLVFFMITSDILPLKSLNIENPSLPLASEARTTQILVVMDAENVIYVGSKKEIVDLESVEEALRREITKNKIHYPHADTTVVLSIDKSVEYSDFLKLLALVQTTQTKIRLAYMDTTNLD